jgi:hypothetical protein
MTFCVSLLNIPTNLKGGFFWSAPSVSDGKFRERGGLFIGGTEGIFKKTIPNSTEGVRDH